MISIDDIKIVYCEVGGGICTHSDEIIKTLPYLSVAQSIAGSYDIAIDDGEILSTGNMGAFIAPALCRQHIRHRPPDDGVTVVRWVFFDAVINSAYSLDDLFDFCPLIPPNDGAELSRLMDGLSAPKKPTTDIAEVITQKTAELNFLRFLMQFSREKPKRHGDAHLSRAVNYMRNKYAEQINISCLASVAGMSESAFFAKFKAAYGQSPAAYLNEIRLSAAARLLINTRKTVNEIAAACGYNDPLYFSAAFKKRFLSPPSDYRKNHPSYSLNG